MARVRGRTRRPVRQSERRGDLYSSRRSSRLRERLGLVYACGLSRAEILAALKGRSTDDRTPDVEPALQGPPILPPTPSFAIPESAPTAVWPKAPASGCGCGSRRPSERFVDLRHGMQEQRPSEQCGDVLVRDREGNWTYQFAATVDDLVQGVTLVVRGDDLLGVDGTPVSTRTPARA